MATFAKVLLAALLQLPASYHDRAEPPADREARLGRIAFAVDAAVAEATCDGQSDGCTALWGGSPAELASVVLALGWWETRYAWRVHAGRCAQYECGARTVGGRLVHASITPWQIERSVLMSAAEWSSMEGDDLAATTVAARVATRILLAGRRRCRTWTGAIAAYAGVPSCRWSQAPRRWATAAKIRKQIDGALETD